MATISRSAALIFSISNLCVATAGAIFCILRIYENAQLPSGDGSGMQWITLTFLSLLFLLMVVPCFMAGIRGLGLLYSREELRRSDVISGPLKPILATAGAIVTFLSLLF